MAATSPVDYMKKEAPTAPYKIYTVVKDDNLTQIVRKHPAADLGTGENERVNKLYELNKRVIGNNKNIIQPGQELYIPISPQETELDDFSHPITANDVGKSLDWFVRKYYKDWMTRTKEELSDLKEEIKHKNNNLFKFIEDKIFIEEKDNDEPKEKILYLPKVGPEVGYSVEIPYDFYRPNLWLSRVPSIIDSITSTLDLFLEALARIDGLSVNVVKDISDRFPFLMLGDNEYDPAYKEIANLEIELWKLDECDSKNGDKTKKLVVRYLDLLLRKLKWIHAPRGFLNLGEQQTYIDLYLDAAVPVTDGNGAPSPDPEFELKQLLNLYTYCCSLLHFVCEPLLMRIASLLPGYWQEKHFRKYPPIDLIDESLRRASIDIEIIQRAIVQRRRAERRDGRYQMTIQARTLLIADKLAVKALTPFQHLLVEIVHPGNENEHDIPTISPITYFSERTHIRRVPYSNIVLVGISYAHISRREEVQVFALIKDMHEKLVDILNERLESMPKVGELGETKSSKNGENVVFWPAFELMAIPHEVGHFIYHHPIEMFYHHPREIKTYSCKTFAELTDKFITDPTNNNPDIKLYSHWCEEIFADVYGCVIAGPLTAMGMQALSAAKSERTLCKDDGEHPLPIFRPFMISQILRVLAEMDSKQFNFQNAPDKLDENWKKILQLRGYWPVNEEEFTKKFTVGPPDGKRKDVSIGEVLVTVQPIVEFYVEHLLHNLYTYKPWDSNDEILSDIPWSSDKTELADYDKVMEDLTSPEFASKKLSFHSINLEKNPTFIEGDYLEKPHAVDEEEYVEVDPQSMKETEIIRDISKNLIPDASQSPETVNMIDKKLAQLDEILKNSDEAEMLMLNYLKEWGDSGPSGFGGH